MFAIRKTEKAPGLTISNIPEPKLLDNEVLVKVSFASICGSDIFMYNWTGWAPSRLKLPVTLGHEVTGIVVDKTSSVSGIKIGDRVSLESHVFCSSCKSCLNDKKHVCDRLKIIGIDIDGGFAEYIKIPASCCWKLPDSFDLRYASLLEPFGNAVHIAEGFELLGKSVLVIGCGPIGIFLIQLLNYFGAKEVWATDLSDFRLERASSCGATKAVNVVNQSLGKVAASSQLEFDYVFEMSGNSGALVEGLKLVKNGGSVITFGLQKNEVSIDVSSLLIMKEVALRGVIGRHIFKTWETMSKVLASGKINLETVVTHRLPLAEFDKGFKMLASGEKSALKVVFDIG